ncbi:MAG: hypothetical protein ACPLXC_03190, partial [Candidatus Pacearchaeota archaeon]
SEPSIYLFEQAIKRIQELSDLTKDTIPQFGDSILDPILGTVVEGECAPSETDFFMGLVKEAEQIIAAKGSLAGMGALDEAYVAPDNTNAGVVEIKQHSEFSDIISKYKLSELGATAKGALVINSILERRYETALKIAKDLPWEYRAKVQSIINEIKKLEYNVNQNSINKSEKT